ncbi:copper chaperone PCu(A)C [Uliginosibacterium gangwonense]|uniref:copper chaperone PCu(A)C n=1 Tax=Uliginosibacterium gangwonense TaxID=392736 RepID=UPI00036A65AA|nr:copper chaperone PCu(A)C [Uliginosibacterium gangwonense]
MKSIFSRTLWIALLALFSFASFNAQAHGYTLGKLKIHHPWARATVAGQPSGGGFLRIDNSGEADRLISAEADVSKAVELHSMSMDGEVMRMRKLDNGIELPAGQTVELKPGNLHIMFIELKAPLKEGSKFPLHLKFEKAGEIDVEVQVEAVGAAPMHH